MLMADATPRSYIFALIAFTFVILGVLALYSGFASYNPTMVSNTKYADFNSTFNRYSDLEGNITGMRSSITDSENEIGIFGVLNGLINTAWNSLKFMFTSFSFSSDILNGLTTVFGIPAWIPALIILSITVMLIFVIWSAIFQSEL
jgi:hypothetical protein